MDSKSDALEYNILGYRVKLRPDATGSVTPDEVVEYVRQYSGEMMDKMPNLSAGEAALLIALKLTQEKLELEKEYRDEVEQFRTKAKDALRFIEGENPSAQ